MVVHDLPAAQADRTEEIKGPREGAPPQALEGFLRKTGLAREQLVERDGVLFAVMMGLRHEVGGDWFNYLPHFQHAATRWRPRGPWGR